MSTNELWGYIMTTYKYTPGRVLSVTDKLNMIKMATESVGDKLIFGELTEIEFKDAKKNLVKMIHVLFDILWELES